MIRIGSHFKNKPRPLVRFQSDSSFDKVTLAQQLSDLGSYPTHSNILNAQHFYQNQVLLEWTGKNAHPVSLRQLAGFGRILTKEKIITSANFVRIELPIRLALRIRDLQRLPFGVANNFHLSQVYESYYHAFNSFRRVPRIDTLQDNESFCLFLSTILDDHLFNLPHLMMGALEVSVLESLPRKQLDDFMSSMLRSRISRRVIVEQHLSLTENYANSPYESKPPNYIGEMFHECSAVESFKYCAKLARDSISKNYPRIKMPELLIEGDDAIFPFMESHLHYIFGEILRNSYEATIENLIRTNSLHSVDPPPIKITICDTKYDVLLRISDQGGGLSEQALRNIWSFAKDPEILKNSLENFYKLPGLQLQSGLAANLSGPSTQKPAEDVLKHTSLGEIHNNQNSNDTRGDKYEKSSLNTLTTRPYKYRLGLGLPMCKIYSDYWNGDLQMNSLNGFGCDTSLKLSKLGYHKQVAQLDRA